MTVFFDCCCLVGRSEPVSGVPRTVQRLYEQFRDCSNVRFVFTSDDTDNFLYAIVDEDSGRPVATADVVNFGAGDILFTAGPTWAISTFNRKVAEMKHLGASFYQLFYDLIPKMFPHFYEDGAAFGDYYAKWLEEALFLCDGAFAISEQTKNDMVSCFGLTSQQSDRITVVIIGDDFFSSNKDFVDNHWPRQRYGNYVLCVGTLELRKNQVILLEAYRHLASDSDMKLPKLLLVGKEGWNDGGVVYQVSTDPNLLGRVEVLSDVTDEDLVALYKNAMFTLYPSFYEGWGLPISESLMYGKICICSGTSSMKEIAPDLLIYASPYVAGDWISLIRSVTQSSEFREHLTKKIENRYEPQSWATMAADIIDQFGVST